MAFCFVTGFFFFTEFLTTAPLSDLKKNRLSPSFPKIYLVFQRFTGFYRVFQRCAVFYRVWRSLLEFYRVLRLRVAFFCYRVFTEFLTTAPLSDLKKNRLSPSFTGFYSDYRFITEFSIVWTGLTEFYRVLLGFDSNLLCIAEFSKDFTGFTEFCEVWSSFTEFYRVLPSFTEFYQLPLPQKLVFTEFYSVLSRITVYYRVFDSLTALDWIRQGFTEFLPSFWGSQWAQVVPAFIVSKFYWANVSCFYRVSTELCRTLPSFSSHFFQKFHLICSNDFETAVKTVGQERKRGGAGKKWKK